MMSTTRVFCVLAAMGTAACHVGDIGSGAESGAGGAASGADAVTDGSTTSGVPVAGAGGADATASGVGGASTSTTSAASTSSAAVTTSAASGGGMSVCDQWQAARANLSEGSWSGSVAACNAGDTSADGRQHALALVNLYRALVDLPPATLDDTRNAAAQECALMMHANTQLSHTPPSSWKCYSDTGAGAAGKSNIATTPGVQAVDLYMVDPGNETTIGHRRWILSNSLGAIGLGSTNGYSCMWVIGGGQNAGKKFVAWPPAGQIPIDAWSVSFTSIDSTGWTVQSDSIGLGSAKVKVSDNGADMPVDTVVLGSGYGSTSAIRFNPKGWKAQAGHNYEVTVEGASEPISYVVEVVSCP